MKKFWCYKNLLWDFYACSEGLNSHCGGHHGIGVCIECKDACDCFCETREEVAQKLGQYVVDKMGI